MLCGAKQTSELHRIDTKLTTPDTTSFEETMSYHYEVQMHGHSGDTDDKHIILLKLISPIDNANAKVRHVSSRHRWLGGMTNVKGMRADLSDSWNISRLKTKTFIRAAYGSAMDTQTQGQRRPPWPLSGRDRHKPCRYCALYRSKRSSRKHCHAVSDYALN